MKQFLTGFLIAAVIFGSTAVFAAQYTATTATFKVFVNGKEFTPTNGQILVVEGRTYLPLADIGTALGTRVVWNADARQVEVGTPPQAPTANVGVIRGDAAQELEDAKKAVTELKKGLKNPNSVILNDVRVFYRFGTNATVIRFTEIWYTGENSYGGSASGYFIYPALNGQSWFNDSQVEKDNTPYTNIDPALI